MLRHVEGNIFKQADLAINTYNLLKATVILVLSPSSIPLICMERLEVKPHTS
jgi:hypothetical protein